MGVDSRDAPIFVGQRDSFEVRQQFGGEYLVFLQVWVTLEDKGANNHIW
jgi:hypothetical protein